MNIGYIKTFLQNQYGYTFDSGEMYNYIDCWRDWWQGYNKAFHRYKERNGNKLVSRDIFSMKMAKRVCEDWASILWTPETEIAFADEQTSKYMLGDDETGEGGLLNELSFWPAINSFVEDSFWSGTGVAVIHFKNAKFVDDYVVNDTKTKLSIDFLPADYFIPLSVENGNVTEAAIVSEFTSGAIPYAYLEVHRKGEDGTYIINNHYFNRQNGRFELVPPPEGVLEEYHTGSTVPLFSVLTPNIKKNIDCGHGMGLSIFADAIDQLKAVDLAFNNFCVDFKLGGKKVFYTQDLIRYDEEGHAIAPDDVAQQLFLQVGDGDSLNAGTKPLTEYNPTLRVAENSEGVQKALDYLSFKCGMGTKHYQFNGGTVVTATQYHGDKQELVQHAAKHTANVDKAIKGILKALLWAAKELCGAPVDPATQITLKFSDNYVVDPDTQRERDRQDVRDGLMMKWEYRVKWYGDTEDEAKAILSGDEDLNPFNLVTNNANT